MTFISDCLCTTVMTKWAGYPVLPNHDGKTINVTDNTILVTVSKYVTGNLSWITRFLVVSPTITEAQAATKEDLPAPPPPPVVTVTVQPDERHPAEDLYECHRQLNQKRAFRR